MKHQWLEKHKTCNKLSQELGIEVRSITKGEIGDEETFIRGIEIEFDTEPTAEQLEKIDVMFKPLNVKRTDGITADAHWAIVDSFHLASEKPLRVTRRNRLIDCYVTQSVVALYLAGQLNIGDMVVGIFVDGDIDKPLISDKIYRP